MGQSSERCLISVLAYSSLEVAMLRFLGFVFVWIQGLALLTKWIWNSWVTVIFPHSHPSSWDCRHMVPCLSYISFLLLQNKKILSLKTTQIMLTVVSFVWCLTRFHTGLKSRWKSPFLSGSPAGRKTPCACSTHSSIIRMQSL